MKTDELIEENEQLKTSNMYLEKEKTDLMERTEYLQRKLNTISSERDQLKTSLESCLNILEKDQLFIIKRDLEILITPGICD